MGARMENRDLMDRISYGVLIAVLSYVSLVPFYYFAPLSLFRPSFDVFKFLPFVLCGGATGLRLWLHGRELTWHGSDMALILFVLFSLASLGSAAHPGVGAAKLVYFTMTGIGLVYAIRSLSRSRSYRVGDWLGALGGIVAIYGLVTFWTGLDPWRGLVGSEHYYSSGRMNSTVGNPIVLGGLLCLSTPFLISSAAGAEGYLKRMGLVVLLIVSGVAVFLTYSRSAWIGIGVVVLFWLIAYRWSLWHRLKRSALVLCLTVLVGLPTLYFPFSGELERGLSVASDRLTKPFAEDGNVTYRLAQYDTSWSILASAPLLGIGFGNLTRYLTSRSDEPEPLSSHTTENMYLMIACETGVLGLLSIGGFLIWFCSDTFRSLRKASTPRERLVLLATLSATCGCAVNMVFWDGLNHPAVRILFWTVVGIGSRFTLRTIEGGLCSRQDT
jgi:O-antigen ligase